MLINGLGIGVPYKTFRGAGEILNQSSLYLPLKSTIVPSKGTSTPTFTRATTAWCFDNEGKLNLNVPSGCARFKGGRFVRNLVTGASETFNTSAWAAVVLTKQANSITSDASVAFQNLQQNVLNSYLTGHTIQFGLRVQYVSQQYVQLSFATAVMGSGQYCNFDLLNGIYNATGCAAGMTQVSSGVFDIWINPVATASASGGPFIVFTNSLTSARYEAFTGGAGKVIGLLRAWINNVSGQSNQTPSEYVSVGVLSSPYHGAGVDGCKWFPTNKDGSAISTSTLEGYLSEPVRTNNCLWGRNLAGMISSVEYTTWKWVNQALSGATELISNVDFTAGISGWTAYNGATLAHDTGRLKITTPGGAFAGAYATVTCVTGNTYTVTYDHIAGDASVIMAVGTSSGSTALGYVANSGTTSRTISFIATQSTMYVSFYHSIGTTVGKFAYIDNVSVKESAIQVTTTTGLDNVANSASRLTAAANDATIMQLLTAATGTRTASAFIKRISGTGTISLTRNGGTNWTDITSSLVTDSWVLVQMTSDVGANPTVGIKMGTSGDVIDVDCVQDENGAWATSPILTTTAAVTRNADVLSYASAFDVTQGTALCSVNSDCTVGNGEVVALNGDSGSAKIMYWSSATARTGGSCFDGTIAVSATGMSINTGVRKRASRWGADLRACADGTLGASGAFDGGMGATPTLFVGVNQSSASQLSGTIRDVHIWPTPLTDTQMKQVTS